MTTKTTAAAASSSPTIEDMADTLGIDGMFEALDTEDAGHPDGAPNGPSPEDNPPKKKKPLPEAADDDEETEGDEPEEETEADDEEGEDEGKDETPEDGASELELETTEVAQLFGLGEDAVTVDDDGKIAFKTKIDGEEGSVHLDTLVESYQIKGHLTKQSQKFAEERTAAQAYLQQQAQALSDQLEQAEALTVAVRDRLISENKSVDWERLRKTDPAEYAAKRQELGEQYRQVDSYLQNVQGQRQQQGQQAYEDEQQRMKAYLAEEGQKILTAVPEWNDEKVRTTELGEIKSYLAGKGFTPAEINNISDSRHLMILRDVVKQKAVKQKVDVAKKKVARIPKVIKPGAKTSSQSQGKRTKRKVALKRQASSGSIDDTAAVFYDLLDDV